MRRLGVVLMIIGLVLTLITGFKFFTKEKVADLGKVEISADKKHSVAWSPYLGIGVIIVGGILFAAGRRGSL